MIETSGESGSAVRETVGQALEKSKDTAQQGVEKAKEAAGEARGVAARELEKRSTVAGERASGLAQATRRIAGELRGEGDEETARLAEAAAERVERLGGYLRESDGEKFLRDLEGFARRRPMLAATAGFVVGLMASRFVKASAERRAFSTNRDGGSETGYRGAQQPAPVQHFGHAEGAV